MHVYILGWDFIIQHFKFSVSCYNYQRNNLSKILAQSDNCESTLIENINHITKLT